jgi:MFS transporter, ACS family, hexuronate transporter
LTAATTIWRGTGGVVLIMLMFGGVLNYIDRQTIAVLKPMLQQDLHWTDGDYGTLTSVFQLSSALAFLVAGWIVDRVGWRRANPLAVGVWSLAAMAHALARTIGQFTIARVVLGASEALGTPTAIKTIAAIFSREQRSFALGIMNAANTCGAIVTPLIIPALALKVGWANAFLIGGGLGLIWVAVWFVLRPGRTEIAHARPAVEVAAEGARVPLGLVLRDRRTWAIAGAKALSDQVWWLLLFWMPDLFHRVFHLSMTGFGAPLAVIYACSATGSVIAGFASSRMLEAGISVNRTRKTVLLIAALLVVPVLLVPNAPSYWIATGLLGLTLAAHQGFSVNIFALATDISSPRRVATVISIGALCGNLAGMVILQAAGWVLGSGLGYAPLLAWASISYLLGVGWIQLLLPRIEPVTDESLALGAVG